MNPSNLDKSRSPASSPQPGDVLKFGAYTVKVLDVTDDRVFYSKKLGRSKATQASQPLATWQGWAVHATVKSLAGCVPLTEWAAGACSACGKYFDGLHVNNGALVCVSCCGCKAA